MNRTEYKSLIEYEKTLYLPNNHIASFKYRLLGFPAWYRWKLVRNMRRIEYYKDKKNSFFGALIFYYAVANNFQLGRKLGIELSAGVFDEGLEIYHTNGTVINGFAKVGKNCKLHGANVIGNKGNDLKAPVIGDNVRLGHGAKVIGDIYIADNVQIGAGAIVTHSCYERGATLVGIPATIYTNFREEE